MAAAISLGAPVGAGGATALSLHGVSKMLTDTAHDQTFITGVPASDSGVAVVDGDGAVVKTITGEDGAGGMALDGSNLYVARCGWATIDVIDTATLQKIDSFAAPGLATVCDLGLAGGRLWYTTGSGQNGVLMAVSLLVAHRLHHWGQRVQGDVRLRAGRRAEHAGRRQSRPVAGTVTVYDVSAADPAVVTSQWNLGSCSNGQDIARCGRRDGVPGLWQPVCGAVVRAV